MFHEAVQNQGKYYKQGSSVIIDTKLIAILERGVATGVFRPLDPLQAAINIMGACLFYFIGQGNIKHVLQGKQTLATMSEEHTKEAIAFILAGVRHSSILPLLTKLRCIHKLFSIARSKKFTDTGRTKP